MAGSLTAELAKRCERRSGNARIRRWSAGFWSEATDVRQRDRASRAARGRPCSHRPTWTRCRVMRGTGGRWGWAGRLQSRGPQTGPWPSRRRCATTVAPRPKRVGAAVAPEVWRLEQNHAAPCTVLQQVVPRQCGAAGRRRPAPSARPGEGAGDGPAYFGPTWPAISASWPVIPGERDRRWFRVIVTERFGNVTGRFGDRDRRADALWRGRRSGQCCV